MSSRLSNWAAIAEIASAVAVVISLIYVGFEISQNTTSVRASAFQSVSDSLTDFTALVAVEPDLAKFYTQGRENPDSLTSDEKDAVQFSDDHPCSSPGERIHTKVIRHSQRGPLGRFWRGV